MCDVAKLFAVLSRRRFIAADVITLAGLTLVLKCLTTSSGPARLLTCYWKNHYVNLESQLYPEDFVLASFVPFVWETSNLKTKITLVSIGPTYPDVAPINK